MERQLLPAAQYANCHSFERIATHKSIQYCLSLEDVVRSVECVHKPHLGNVLSHAVIVMRVLHLFTFMSYLKIAGLA